uniref:Uncharacterized protein n=1 Tax=viral metagenome TaxID=1070528 RepID=A0A6C0ED36_9ZZZZ
MEYFNKYLKYKQKYSELKKKNNIINSNQFINYGGGTRGYPQPIPGNDQQFRSSSRIISVGSSDPLRRFLPKIGIEDQPLNLAAWFIERASKYTPLKDSNDKPDPAENKETIISDINKYSNPRFTFSNKMLNNFDIMLWCNNLTTSTSAINIKRSYRNAMEQMYGAIKQILEKNTPSKTFIDINWFDFNGFDDITIRYLCVFREYIICLVLQTCFALNNCQEYKASSHLPSISIINEISRQSQVNFEPNVYFDIGIVGSDQLLSDIDVNIRAINNSSFWLSIIEDLFEIIPWFNHTNWRVDFYGDFKSVRYRSNKDKDLNIEWFPKLHYTEENLKLMLKYSIMSIYKNNENVSDEHIEDYKNIAAIYFKKEIIDKINTDEIKNFINEIKKKKNEDSVYRQLRLSQNKQENNAFNPEPDLTNQEYRNEYYKKLEIIDFFTNVNKKLEFSNYDLQDILIKLADSNLYREENYILIDSVIHVVQCLQSTDKKEDSRINKDSLKQKSMVEINNHLFISNPCNDLPIYSYVLSSIEQYSFMIHYLSGKNKCNLTANKYFNRILDAFIKIINIINPLNKNVLLKDIINNKEESDKIIALKKCRSAKGISNVSCIIDKIDLQNQITEIQTTDLDLLDKIRTIIKIMPKNLSNQLI